MFVCTTAQLQIKLKAKDCNRIVTMVTVLKRAFARRRTDARVGICERNFYNYVVIEVKFSFKSAVSLM